MITAIAIKNLRGIREGELKDLAPLTILVGPNNCGKSTVLDAIMIAASPNPQTALFLMAARRRDLGQPNKWVMWRRGDETRHEGLVEVCTDGSEKRFVEFFRPDPSRDELLEISHRSSSDAKNTLIRMRHTASGDREVFTSLPLGGISEVRFVDPFGAAPPPDLHRLVTRAVERGLMKDSTSLISELAPEVQDIRILSPENVPVVYLVFEDGALPEATAGDGIRMLLRLVLELAAPLGGIELIEEPEMHMHPAAIRLVARAMWAAVGRGIQIVVSTHSLDLLDFLLGGCPKENLDKIAVFRLALVNGELKSTRYSGQEAQFARTEVEKDLR